MYRPFEWRGRVCLRANIVFIYALLLFHQACLSFAHTHTHTLQLFGDPAKLTLRTIFTPTHAPACTAQRTYHASQEFYVIQNFSITLYIYLSVVACRQLGKCAQMRASIRQTMASGALAGGNARATAKMDRESTSTITDNYKSERN